MYPAQIDHFVAPRDVASALAERARLGDGALFLAGGMSAMQAIKSRLLRPTAVIDLNGVDELRSIEVAPDRATIGGMTRYREVAAAGALDGGLEALRDAAGHVGDRQVRNRGTIGGSVCWNYMSACMPAVILALDAEVELAAPDGSRRRLAARDFLGGPLETAREDDELLIAIHLPRPAATGSAYRKWGLVTDALPVVGCASRVTLASGGRLADPRISISGLATGPIRLDAAEKALAGADADDREAIRRAIAEAAEAVETHDDLWATASYRRLLIETLGAEVIAKAVARAGA